MLSHTIFHTIFVNNSLTHISVTHHPPASHFTPSSSHTLRHIPSFTHNFVARRLSHTIFHISLWLKQKRMEQKTHVYLAASPACFGMFAFLACLVQAEVTGAVNLLDIKFMFCLPVCLPSCVSGLFWHVCFSGLFSSSKSDWSRKLFGHQIHVSCAGMFT